MAAGAPPASSEMRVSRVVAVALFVVAALAPLPFGSTGIVATALWLLILSVSATAAAWAAGAPRRLPIAAVASVALAFVMLAIVQTMSPPAMGEAFPLWAEGRKHLDDSIRSQIAAAADQPLLALASPLLGAAAAICGIAISASSRTVRRFLKTFAQLGAGYAAIAIIHHAVNPGYVLWWPKRSHVDDLTATFTNRNTVAVFIGMALVVLAGRAAALADRYLSAKRRGQDTLLAELRRTQLLVGGQITVCFLAIALTNSRAGGLLSLLAATLAAALRLRRRFRLTGFSAIVGGGAVMAFALILFVSLDTRLSTSSLEDGGRSAAYVATYRMAMEFPWLGVGLGCFAVAFPMWRLPDASMWGTWERAHNSVLELAAEAGLPFTAMILACWLAVLVLLARSAWRRRNSASAATFAICTLGLAHALIDFSIQIPGFQIAYYAIVGIGIGQIFDPSQESRKAADRANARAHSLNVITMTQGSSLNSR